jgi:NAD(P)-dependent dehydrogenase (short-subunit alcohol dehydrogenase family)
MRRGHAAPSLSRMDIALITGASRGLGLALAQELADDGYGLVIDARGSEALERARSALAARTEVTAIAGDVADPDHRAELVAVAVRMGRLRLLVNNASVLGPSPQPDLGNYPMEVLESVYRINVLAPLGLIQLALPALHEHDGTILNITSDAAAENYPGWGGYGSSKAALEQLSNVLAAERPDVRVYWADPGDMRTRMHQEAFPGEDISDRPEPAESVPGLLRLIERDLPSGRYRARDFVPSGAAA